MDTWDRLEQLVGKEKMKDIQTKTVAIIGLGGVGGYAVEALARSGIGTLILIDHDTIENSNINRQLIALNSTIGLKKTEAWKERIQEINPHCNIILKDIFLTKENLEAILSLPIDYIIDACDTISTKIEIIYFSIQNKIKCISCMGMGNKLDPTKIKVTTLDQTSYDPIAKKLRKLVKEKNIAEKITVISSTEPPAIHEKVIASNAFVPGTAGLLCASYVIKDIVGGV